MFAHACKEMQCLLGNLSTPPEVRSHRFKFDVDEVLIGYQVDERIFCLSSETHLAKGETLARSEGRLSGEPQGEARKEQQKVDTGFGLHNDRTIWGRRPLKEARILRVLRDYFMLTP